MFWKAALTPDPSPALRERGELLRESRHYRDRWPNHAPNPALRERGELVRESPHYRDRWRNHAPNPALRERGDLVRERDIVGRIATAALISPFLASYGRGRGPGGR